MKDIETEYSDVTMDTADETEAQHDSISLGPTTPSAQMLSSWRKDSNEHHQFYSGGEEKEHCEYAGVAEEDPKRKPEEEAQSCERKRMTCRHWVLLMGVGYIICLFVRLTYEHTETRYIVTSTDTSPSPTSVPSASPSLQPSIDFSAVTPPPRRTKSSLRKSSADSLIPFPDAD